MNDLMDVERELDRLAPLLVEWGAQALGAILILVIGFIVTGLISRWARDGLARLPNVDLTLARFLATTIRYALLVLVLVTVLAQFGVQTTSIIAALGAAGLAIGLALQGTLSNIAAGIMLLVLRPFRVGDYVKAGEVDGVVEEIGLFTTDFRKLDGLYLMAPNSTIWNQPILNYSRNPTRRIEVVVGIDYEDDIERAKSALLALATGDERVLDDPAPDAHVMELADSSVNLRLWAWTATPDFFATQNDVRRRAKERFDEEGLTIPFPQYEVKQRAAKGGADAAPAQAVARGG